MANNIGWGQGVINNSIDWGKGVINNVINWGKIYASSYSGETVIIGIVASVWGTASVSNWGDTTTENWG
jgi:hypothetical protein